MYRSFAMKAHKKQNKQEHIGTKSVGQQKNREGLLRSLDYSGKRFNLTLKSSFGYVAVGVLLP
jgi:hypothetical protein